MNYSKEYANKVWQFYKINYFYTTDLLLFISDLATYRLKVSALSHSERQPGFYFNQGWLKNS